MNKNLSQTSDQILVQQFLKGKESAINELIYKHKDAVYTSIIIMVKDQYIAEDLFQETFIKVVQNLRKGKYADQGKFLPWAIRIAHNLCIDYFRKVKQNVRVVTKDGLDLFELLSIDNETPETVMAKSQTMSQVQQLINLLPDEQREVVVLRIYANMSFKEIADLTGVSINTALGRMRYALINLKRVIEEKNLILR